MVIGHAGIVLVAVLLAGCTPTPATPLPIPARTATNEPAPAVIASLIDPRLRRAWPDDPHGTAWFTDAGYRLAARAPGEFVAVRAPTVGPIEDARISAVFRKIGGPSGGGYGLIVRDQRSSLGNGLDQGGQFVVAAVGDRGEFGVWRRDGQQWLDLVPWTPSPRIHAGDAANEVTLRLEGDRLRFDVNGAQVADVTAPLKQGSIGLFAGGDLNEVLVEHLTIERLPSPRSPLPPTKDAPATARRDVFDEIAQLQALTERAHQLRSSDASRERIERVQVLLASLEEEVVGLLDVWSDGFTGPNSPVENPQALRRANDRLQHAASTAAQLRAELDALRPEGDVPRR